MSSVGSVATTMRGGVFISAASFFAACRSASVAASLPGGGGGFASTSAFTAGEGASTLVQGPMASGAWYQKRPPVR